MYVLQIPRAFLAVELPDMEVESMASITKVVTLEEVKTLLQGLLEEGDAQQLRRRLSMEAAVIRDMGFGQIGPSYE